LIGRSLAEAFRKDKLMSTACLVRTLNQIMRWRVQPRERAADVFGAGERFPSGSPATPVC
jgi:hypothetical protein